MSLDEGLAQAVSAKGPHQGRLEPSRALGSAGGGGGGGGGGVGTHVYASAHSNTWLWLWEGEWEIVGDGNG